MTRLFWIGLLLLMAYCAFYSSNEEQKRKATMSPQEYAQLQGCRGDWHKCKDNAQLMNEYGDRSKASVACESAAKARARYGSPTFPWVFSFTHYRNGTDYITTGTAQLGEPDAQYQNQFGTMEHVDVECTFDLNCTEELWSKCVRTVAIYPATRSELLQ